MMLGAPGGGNGQISVCLGVAKADRETGQTHLRAEQAVACLDREPVEVARIRARRMTIPKLDFFWQTSDHCARNRCRSLHESAKCGLVGRSPRWSDRRPHPRVAQLDSFVYKT